MKWKYILIVFILAVVVGGGILSYQYWWIPKEEDKTPGVKAPEVTLADETAGWKTYRNEKYGYEIKYPERFINYKIELVESVEDDYWPHLIIGKDSISYFKANLDLAYFYFPHSRTFYYPSIFSDEKIPIESVNDWIKSYSLIPFGEPGHGGVVECYQRPVAGFEGGICEGGSIGVIPVSRDNKSYFMSTPYKNFEAKANIITSYGQEEEKTETSQETIEYFFIIIDQILSTTEFVK